MAKFAAKRIESVSLRKLQRYAAEEAGLFGEVFQTPGGYFYTGMAAGKSLNGYPLGQDRQTARRTMDSLGSRK